MKPHQASVPVAPDTFPKWVLRAMGALLLFALLSVAAVRITGNGPDQLRSVVVTERALRFEDRSDGGIAVIDGASGQLLTALHGEQGFLRGVVRALARERRTRDMGSEQPFLLTARADGSLTLSDPETRQSVELESFGPTNAGVFAKFLAIQPDSISN